MFKLRLYPQQGSENAKKGIKRVNMLRGTKKDLVEIASKLTTIKAEVIREKDNQIVFTNNQ